jgi:hypothetical protein
VELIPEKKKEDKPVNENQNFRLKIETNIQTLLNEIKTLHEIINILSEEWKQCKETEEVRTEKEQYVDEVKANDLISCNCDTVKTQCSELQKEINSISTRTNITKKDIKNIRQENRINLSPTCSVQDINQKNYTDPLTTKYTVSTENRFALLSNYQDTLNNEPSNTQNQYSSPRDPTKISKHQGRSDNQRKRKCTRPTISSLHYTKDKHNQPVNVKNEDTVNYIPTIVNGTTSNSFILESTLDNSAVTSGVNGDCTHRVVDELRESIKVHLKKDNPPLEHRILLIGDSNIRGYASTLQTLLDSNYKIYSIMKPGSDTNELLKTTKVTINQLSQKDMIVLCYGTNDFNQRSLKKIIPILFRI